MSYLLSNSTRDNIIGEKSYLLSNSTRDNIIGEKSSTNQKKENSAIFEKLTQHFTIETRTMNCTILILLLYKIRPDLKMSNVMLPAYYPRHILLTNGIV